MKGVEKREEGRKGGREEKRGRRKEGRKTGGREMKEEKYKTTETKM